MSALNWPAVLETTMGDEELAKDVASAFLDETPRIFETLRSAIENKDSAEAKRAAHTIKGSLRMMSAIGKETAAELEQITLNEQWDACPPLMNQLDTELKEVIAELKTIVG